MRMRASCFSDGPGVWEMRFGSVLEVMKAYRPVWAEVNLRHLRRNVAELHRAAGRSLCAVIKADGYGHGSVVVGQTALQCKDETTGKPMVAGLAVATVQEALVLRKAKLQRDEDWFLLLMGETYDGCEETVIEAGVQPAVGSLQRLHAFAAAAKRLEQPCRVHLKLDSGMGRVGFQEDEFGACVEALLAGGYGCSCHHARKAESGGKAKCGKAECGWACHVEVEGVYSHFSMADEADPSYTQQQAESYGRSLSLLHKRGIRPKWQHLFNSAGTIQHRSQLAAPHFKDLLSHLNLARVGISLYGHAPSADVVLGDVTLSPLLTWKARLTHIKSLEEGKRVSYGGLYQAPAGGAVIGTIPMGYADGFRRRLGYLEDHSESGCPEEQQWHVLIRGRRVPIVGRVCMDMFMVDLTQLAKAVPDLVPGEEVVVLGKMGDEEISSEEMAERLRTINYEISCLVMPRVPRIYMDGDRVVAVRTLDQGLQYAA